MNKRILAMTLVMLLALSVVGIGCPPVPVEPPVPVPVPPVIHEWVVQSVMAAGWAGYPPFVRFAEKLHEMTDGRIKITPHPCGAIVGPFKKIDAVIAGVLDGMHTWSAYWVGKEPAFGPLPGITAGFPYCWMVEAWYWEGGGIELTRELYAKFDLFFVGPVKYGPESLHFVKPVDTIAEFQGLLFRTPPAMTSDLFAGLGASIVILPGPEIYMALDKGVIAGAEFMPLAIMYDMGIHEVAPYFLSVGFHMPAAVTNFVVRMDRWEALTPDLQAILEDAVRSFSRDLWVTCRLADLEARKAMIAAGNVELFFSEAELAKIRAEVAVPIWEAWGEKSPMAARIVESQMAFMRKLGVLE
jgi:TRAP-type mannitol/chloroaromatic compound transport system substrate-binding protein